VGQLFTEVAGSTAYQLHISLSQQTVITEAGRTLSVEVDHSLKLRSGVDTIGVTLDYAQRIRDYEPTRR
jgi:3-isopropylmalate dehydratase small subunit